MKYKLKHYIFYYWTFVQMALGVDRYNHSKTHPNAISAIRAVVVFIFVLTCLMNIASIVRHW